MKKQNINELDGKTLYNCVITGASKIFDNQNYINKINVFPVADADTGTNMASTMRAIIETAKSDNSIKITAEAVADAALIGARGNSGIIFAQFLFGFSNELPDKESISIEEFAVTIKGAVQYAYDAIANPKEGTIITVIREWAEHLITRTDKENDFYHFLNHSLRLAREALKNTTKQMDKLAKAKVVDAGALGFVNFLEGIVEYLKTGEIPDLEELKSVVIEFNEDHLEHDQITYRFCTEALIKGENLNKSTIKILLEGFGDSMVIAGSTKKMRIHIHTDRPWDLFEKLSHEATIIAQKVDDMVMQNDIASHPFSKIAIVTDSACDLPVSIIEKYQIQIIPLNIHFGNTYYLDGITMQPHQFYKQLDSSPVYPTTSQPSFKDFYNRYNYLSSHFKSVIGINLSAKLSGTWQNSLNAANKVSDQTGKTIEIINSKKVSGGQGLLILRAIEAIEKGKTHEDIVAMLPLWAHKTKQFASLTTLKYLVKSGRITKGRGLIGNLLNLKPIIEVTSAGIVENVGKATSNKKSSDLLFSKMEKVIRGKKIWGYAINHANNQKAADRIAYKMEMLTGKKPKYFHTITPVLIAHVGIGAVSLAVMLE